MKIRFLYKGMACTHVILAVRLISGVAPERVRSAEYILHYKISFFSRTALHMTSEVAAARTIPRVPFRRGGFSAPLDAKDRASE